MAKRLFEKLKEEAETARTVEIRSGEQYEAGEADDPLCWPPSSILFTLSRLHQDLIPSQSAVRCALLAHTIAIYRFPDGSPGYKPSLVPQLARDAHTAPLSALRRPETADMGSNHTPVPRFVSWTPKAQRQCRFQALWHNIWPSSCAAFARRGPPVLRFLPLRSQRTISVSGSSENHFRRILPHRGLDSGAPQELHVAPSLVA